MANPPNRRAGTVYDFNFEFKREYTSHSTQVKAARVKRGGFFGIPVAATTVAAAGRASALARLAARVPSYVRDGDGDGVRPALDPTNACAAEEDAGEEGAAVHRPQCKQTRARLPSACCFPRAARQLAEACGCFIQFVHCTVCCTSGNSGSGVCVCVCVCVCVVAMWAGV